MAWEWLGPTATAVVGVAGIAGAVTAAALGRRAQLEVAKMIPAHSVLSEKRTVYTNFLRSARKSLRAGERLNREQRAASEVSDSPEAASRRAFAQSRIKDMLVEARTTNEEMFTLIADVTLIGGPLIGALANHLAGTVMASLTQSTSEARERTIRAWTDVSRAMHEDVNPIAAMAKSHGSKQADAAREILMKELRNGMIGPG